MSVAESLTYVTPLGVRFLDSATRQPVSEGLVVTADGLRAYPNRVGVFLLSGVPGLRAAEYGAGDEAYWADPPAHATVTVQVDDPEGRFLPFTFEADLPARGPFELACGSPPGPEGAVELFSAPSRLAPAGSAVVRTELWDGEADAPAAWALLEVRAPGMPVTRGLADARGRVTVVFPYPEPSALVGSPPGPGRALTAETWTLQIDAFAAPQPDPVPARPDLCTVLTQPPAALLASVSPATPLTDATLEYGRELVLRSSGQSVLVLIPAA